MAAPDPDTPLALAAWLIDHASAAVLAAAESAVADSAGDPVAAAAALRRREPQLTPARASAALEQAGLRRLAWDRYGVDAGLLLLTRDGLEQATGPRVAAHRARLLREAGANRAVDLTGGLGFDTGALLSAGLAVTAVERDPDIATFLSHNCPGADVVVADAADPGLLASLLAGLGPTDVVFVDPARRDPHGARGPSLRARPERDPARWSPPWSLIQGIPHPRVAAKVAPAFVPPDAWHAEWVSVQGALVECAVYSWPVLPSRRRAVMWSGEQCTVVDADDSPPSAAASDLGAWLHEPDPAVLRAGAVPAITRASPGLLPVDPASTWLTGSADGLGAAFRSYQVIEVLEGSTTAQRRQLDRLGVAGLTVKSRDAGVAPRAVLRDVGRPEGAGHVLVLTRRGGRTIRVLCGPVRPRSG